MMSHYRFTPVLLLCRVAIVAGAITFWAGTSLADFRDPELVNPDKTVQELIMQNADIIRSHIEKALDSNASTAERIEGIEFASGIYFDYLLANREALVQADDPMVALTAVMYIGGQISMLAAQHGMHRDLPLSAYDVYQNILVENSVSALRLALDHADDSVRNQTAAILASRGDAPALAKIQSFIDEGRMSGKQGIGYLSLAPTNIASPFVEKYLASRDPVVRAAAVGQLSYNPSYTSQIREIALQPGSSEKVVIAALPGLASTDADFLTYSAALAQNKELAPSIREQALESTVKFAIGKHLPASTVNAFAPMLEQASNELASEMAINAYQYLKVTYGIQ